jgi:putative spermidine/putrescine transport system permease protein
VRRGKLSTFLGWTIVTLIGIFLLLPTLVILPMSFSSAEILSFPPQGFSTRWYGNYIKDPVWRDATLNSLAVAVMAAVMATVLGTTAALAMVRGRMPFAGLFRGLFLLPMIVPTIVTAVASFKVFSDLGLTGTLTGLALAHALLGLPFVVINVSAVLRKADPRIEHAARSLGASPWRAFRHVTLPMIAPGVAAGAVFAFLTSFDEVVAAIFLTGIDSTTLPVQMWSGIRFEINPTVAAVSVLLVALSSACFGLFAIFRKP